MDGTNGLKETTRVTAPVASSTLSVKVLTAPWTAQSVLALSLRFRRTSRRQAPREIEIGGWFR